LRDGANQKSSVFLNRLFYLGESQDEKNCRGDFADGRRCLAEKKFLFKENIAVLQFEQAIPAQAIIITILNKSTFFVS
jgi:hypothetical protein